MDPLRIPDLTSRCRQAELMDQPGLDRVEHARALRGLRRINAWSRTSAVVWSRIARLARERPDQPLRVLDLASGGGDLAIALARRAAREGRDVRIQGCDISPQAVHLAQGRAEAHGVPVRFFMLDVVREDLPDDYDVLTSTLFLHHLDDADAVSLLGKMKTAARRLVLVDDLIRSPWGYRLARVGCRLLSRSPIVHFDGPASVAAAFTVAEARALAARAGLEGATLSRHWPQRFLLSWSRG